MIELKFDVKDWFECSGVLGEIITTDQLKKKKTKLTQWFRRYLPKEYHIFYKVRIVKECWSRKADINNIVDKIMMDENGMIQYAEERLVFFFKEETDAMAFKLRWM